MKNFFILTNSYKDKDLALTNSMRDYITSNGAGVEVYVSKGEELNIDCVDADVIPQDTEVIFVLGGDGTLIRAARDTVSLGIPLAGVNLGTVGYLCELDRENVFEAIDRLMRDEYLIEDRMRLSGRIARSDGTVDSGNALNDIVIHRSGTLQLVNLILYVNGEYLHSFSADGVIISSPTGSTAYNLSAGGPIIDPKARMMVITPICAHDFASKSIVLDSDSKIEIEIGSRRREADERVNVSFDGDRIIELGIGERIEIRQAKEDIHILKLSGKSFLEILRKKL
ncbi:MAG: NAD(+)/NADH kinase [Lachnospiraceae bacterium]|nr:NAD(+)/NADH kinase [Lachnospiraceae bacterium]